MPTKLIDCVSLPPATISSVPIYDFAIANVGLSSNDMEVYYECCGKSICRGCVHSFRKFRNDVKCPFCNSDHRGSITNEEMVEELMKRVEANDPCAIYVLGNSYDHGVRGLLQDQERAMDLYARSRSWL